MVSQNKMEKIEAGVTAWQTGQPYHDSKKSRVYHTDSACPAGVSIELRHLREGVGTGRAICSKC